MCVIFVVCMPISPHEHVPTFGRSVAYGMYLAIVRALVTLLGFG